ncbi:helicase HerA domain-containing protein [Nocardia sp. NPDC004123]
MTELIPGVGAGSLLQAQLLADDRSTRIGAIYRLDYSEAIVLTHDRWKFIAGGIPQFSYLLATAQDINTPQVDDDEVLLLRVEGTAPLSMEADLHAVREESLRAALSSKQDPSPSAILDVEMDPFTRNRVSFTGLKCKILGTFYEDDVDGQKLLEFGADVDNFYATSTYRVLKPVGEGLSTITSYLKPTGRDVKRVRIGAVRYSATRRRAKASKQADAAVEVNIHDFIGNKTALLGMTRMGKSNTAKTIIARTFMVSENRRAVGEAPIGQVIFDPQGEYANANSQDGTEIAAIGEQHVRIFKFGADNTQAHVRPLGINFFDPEQIDAVQGLIADKLRSDGSSGYVKDFASTQFGDVKNDYSQTARAQRGRLLLYGCLLRAAFPAPKFNAGTNFPYSVLISMDKDLRTDIAAEIGHDPFKAAGRLWSIKTDNIRPVIDAIIVLREAGNTKADEFCDDIRWQSTEPIYTGSTSGSSGRVRGWRNLIELKEFHNPDTQRDPAEEIYAELIQGRIVIVDLHVGTPVITRVLSENIVRRILAKQTEVFTSGSDVKPPPIQVMLEEAHNLFASDRYKDDADVWVKLAKEASKLNLGMTYATQEVSGVAHQVKANTANWVVAHLNNTKELRELGQFYDFGSFADAILSSEDRGYVRLKTLSSPYIVPVQIDRYDTELVNQARAAAGDMPLSSGVLF